MNPFRPWYWLESSDDTGLGWHDCIIGEWSLVVGGKNMRPVMRRYRGPWYAEFQPTAAKDNASVRGPFKTVKEAKRAAIEMAEDAIGEIMKAIGKLT